MSDNEKKEIPEEYESLKNEYENRTGLSADEFIRKQLEQVEPVKPENEPVSYTLDGNTYSGDLTSHLKKHRNRLMNIFPKENFRKTAVLYCLQLPIIFCKPEQGTPRLLFQYPS